jgi:histidine triad (HIT) family protein
MATIFTKSIDGDVPAHFVWKDDVCVVFLSINPTNRGHALVVPRAEIDHWLELEPEVVSHLMRVAHAIGKAQQAAWSPARVGLLVAGFEVPHVHVHVVPTEHMGHLNLANSAQRPDPDALAEAAQQLREALRALGHPEVADA